MFQFEENEKKRMKAEQQRQEAKHKKQWEELVFKNETSLRELEQLQVWYTVCVSVFLLLSVNETSLREFEQLQVWYTVCVSVFLLLSVCLSSV
jgi:membrane protein YdbS with pleckstrin-like domain